MTIQTINLGNYANDGTGDDLRTAFQKVNANFAEVAGTASIIGGRNLGTITLSSGTGAGTAITVANTANLIAGMLVSVTGGTGIFASNTRIVSISNPTTFVVDVAPTTPLSGATINAILPGGVFAQRSTTNLEFKPLISTNNTVTFTGYSSAIDLSAKTVLESDVTPQLGGNLSLNGFSIKDINGGDVQAKIYNTSVVALSSLLSLLVESNPNLNVNMGSFVHPTGSGINSTIPVTQQGNTRGYILDFGSFLDAPGGNNLDFGPIVSS